MLLSSSKDCRRIRDTFDKFRIKNGFTKYMKESCWQYDGSSVKENIFKYFFRHRSLGGENIFKYIFTTVFCWEKIYLNIFSPPYFVGRKYI